MSGIRSRRSKANREGRSPMETSASTAPPTAHWLDRLPPLSPVAYVMMIFLPYVAQVFGNAVTLRQIAYNKTFYATYGRSIEPLPDTSILEQVTLPEFTARVAMRDWVNVLSAFWIVSTLLFWFCRGSMGWLNFTTFLAAESILVPLCAVSQWLTTVPDSDPNCLSFVDVPPGDGWIWTRFSLYQCGDMMWSSALVQVVLFSYLSFANIRSRCITILYVLFTSVFIVVLAVVAWFARYQYVCDIVLSFFLSLVTVTHPFTEELGHLLFSTHCSSDHLPNGDNANVVLINNDSDDEFAIEEPTDEDV